MRRTLTSLVVAVGLALLVGPSAGARRANGGLHWATQHDESPPLRTFAPHVPTPQVDISPTNGGGFVGPIQSFEGLRNDENKPGPVRLPPDSDGAVGPLDYVQWDNGSISVYDKLGHRLLGPLTGNAVWRGFGGPCESSNDGDPIVLYDRFADRWLLAQLASPPGPHRTVPYLECVAVSTTGDPTGAYYRYAFTMPSGQFNDYGKLAVWPDAYTMTDRRLGPTGADDGEDVFALDRSAMLAGLPARALWYPLGPEGLGLLPVDDEGQALPSADAPALFVRAATDPDRLELWQLHPDFATLKNSAFAGPVTLATAPFDPRVCISSAACIRQPGAADGLDPVSDRLMFHASYRTVGGVPILVVSHTVGVAPGVAGVRWYEIRDPGSSPTIIQQGTYGPDGDSRWMGSADIDRLGDLAVGFSVSGLSTFPSIGFAGRLPTDPPATLPLREGRLATGSGSEAGFGGRWGDYSSLVVDPVDDCTFWYTQQYFVRPGGTDWHTRIGSFRFPGCGTNPTIAGEAQDGETLTASMAAQPELPDAQVAYQWRRCDDAGASCADIAGATGSVYAVRAADEGSTLRVLAVSSTDAALVSGLSRATAPVPVAPAAVPLDLVAAMTATPSPVSLNTDVAYVIRVSNPSGAGTATGVRLADTPPARTALVSATADRGNCSAAAIITCDLTFLTAGGDATVTVVVHPSGRGSYENVATVTADQTDPDPSSNRAAASVDVRAVPQVAVDGAQPHIARTRGGTIVVEFGVRADEPVRLDVTFAGRRGPPRILLPGSIAGDVRSSSPHRVLVGSLAAPRRGSVSVRVAPPFPRGASPYAVHVRATDQDGLSTSLVVPVRIPNPHH